MAEIPVGRLATGTQMDVLESSMRRIQAEIARREKEISTGVRVQQASDDPLAAVRSLMNQANGERIDQYLKNIDLAAGELNAADGALDALGDIATRAREILLSQISDSATEETRRNAAAEVQDLLDGAVAIANRKFGSRYLFGGNDATSAPAEEIAGGVAFRPGATNSPLIDIGMDEAIARSVNSAQVLGTVGAEIRGGVDLDPRLGRDTRIADLHAGAGAVLGTVRIDDGAGKSALVDLSGAKTVGDAIDLLNATGLATARVNDAGDGLALEAPGANLSVSDVEGGRAAAGLGIAAKGGGATVVGSDLDPRATRTTLLSDLRRGAGIDAADFSIRNGDATVRVDLEGMTTVEDLLNAVNGAGALLDASLDGDGKAIVLRSLVSGAPLSVDEGAGTTAADLGLSIDFLDMPLERLNGGLGVGGVAGDDLKITDKTGKSFSVDLAGAVTVRDVLARINEDPENGGAVVASAVPGESRLRIEDRSGGTGSLRVESVQGSFTAENLGIAGEASGAATEIAGGDVRPGGAQSATLFTALVALRDLLAEGKGAGLGLVEEKLDRATNAMLDARAEVGARSQRLERTQARLQDEKVELEKLIAGDRGADLAESVAEYQRQQTVLQATYAVTGRVLSLSLLDFLR